MSTKNIGKRSTPNVAYPATLELVEAYPLEPQRGVVYVYILSPVEKNEGKTGDGNNLFILL